MTLTTLRQRAVPRTAEMDRKRLLVRYLILAAIGIVLAIKVYLAMHIADFYISFYGLLTSTILCSIFFISFLKYKDPYLEASKLVLQKADNNDDNNNNNGNTNNYSPLVSILVAVKNEEDNIRDCVESCINSSYPKKEVIIVNDASTDKTPQILEEMEKEFSNLHVINLSQNVGKKKAIEAACQWARGEIYVFIDSDCALDRTAVENAVKIFGSDDSIGGLSGHFRVRNAANGNWLEKMQDVFYNGQLRVVRGAESSFSSVTCCSGALTIYRRRAVQPFIHAWANDEFLGIKNFRFATDRRLTAYVLGAKTDDKLDSRNYAASAVRSAFDSHTVTRTEKTDKQKWAWRLIYSPSVTGTVVPPNTFSSYIKQQIRWRKSFIRSISATGGIYWRRPISAAILYYVIMGLKFVRPFIVIKALFFIWLSGDLFSMLYFVGVLYTGMLYAIDVRLRNPGYRFWLYRPLMSLFSTFILSWLLIYAAITIRKTGWR
jgi:hyaluronan synthase